MTCPISQPLLHRKPIKIATVLMVALAFVFSSTARAWQAGIGVAKTEPMAIAADVLGARDTVSGREAIDSGLRNPASWSNQMSGRKEVNPELRPNIILIYLDDADRLVTEYDFLHTTNFKFLPNIDRLACEGIRFSNAHSTTPLCAPSRACLLTGQYAHQHGVMCNDPTQPHSRGVTGGYRHFETYGAFQSTGSPSITNNIGGWMQRAGYRTAFIGKYLHNGFQPRPGVPWIDAIPPGWNEFFASLGSSYFTTCMVKNGRPFQLDKVESGVYPSRYRTAVEAFEAEQFIRRQKVADESPFFLCLAPIAPHCETASELCLEENKPGCGMVEPKYRDWWTAVRFHRDPDFNEVDFADKPKVLQGLAPLCETGTSPFQNEMQRVDLEFRRRLLAMRSVDDMVHKIRVALDELDLSRKTIIILSSDHGYHLGDHRLLNAKKTPFNRSTNIPLFVWGPGYVGAAWEPQTHLLANIDLAPTILELAEAPIPATVQGKSFAAVLQNPRRSDPSQWRPEGLLIENWEAIEHSTRPAQTTYNSLRQHSSIYTQWSNGEREFYDLDSDPYQLKNSIASVDESQLRNMDRQLSALKQDFAAPTSYIEIPLRNDEVFRNEVNLTGIAEFGEPIKRVRLIIEDVSHKNVRVFWNGRDWSQDRAMVDADIANPNGLITDWSYRFQPEIQMERRYRAAVFAISKSGAIQKKATAKTFSISRESIVNQIKSPLSEQTVPYHHAITVSGWTDFRGEESPIRLTIRDTKTLKFWDGAGWHAEVRSVVPQSSKKPGSSEMLWQYEFRPPEGSGTVWVTAISTRTNASDEMTPRRVRFSWLR